MKKILLACAFVIGVSAASFAQQGGGRMRMTPKESVDRLKEKITGISDDQTAKLTAVYTEAGKKRDSIRTAAGDDRQAMMTGMMKMQPVIDTKIKAILTPDQAAEYQKMVDKRIEQMKARMQGGN